MKEILNYLIKVEYDSLQKLKYVKKKIGSECCPNLLFILEEMIRNKIAYIRMLKNITGGLK